MAYAIVVYHPNNHSWDDKYLFGDPWRILLLGYIYSYQYPNYEWNTWFNEDKYLNKNKEYESILECGIRKRQSESQLDDDSLETYIDHTILYRDSNGHCIYGKFISIMFNTINYNTVTVYVEEMVYNSDEGIIIREVEDEFYSCLLNNLHNETITIDDINIDMSMIVIEDEEPNEDPDISNNVNINIVHHLLKIQFPFNSQFTYNEQIYDSSTLNWAFINKKNYKKKLEKEYITLSTQMVEKLGTCNWTFNSNHLIR